ncbi:restriction endonuclease subunit S [Paenibacillus sp. KS-LC4]|uniref:restriction endonuclease subunit S n=1 Tax=Paenibacillus sp. KS-LC4 TaxID=2979727 RepID=UPI0030D24933
MDREQAYMRMLGATANMQWNVALILEAKAQEAEKARNWICNHIHTGTFPGDQTQLKQTLGVHDQMVETIEGINKMSQGIVSVLKAVLQKEGEDSHSSGSEFHFGGGFGGGN